MNTREPGLPGSRQQPEQTAERRITGWQRALRWVAWLVFLGLAVWNSQRVTFSGLEWIALVAAVGISIWCMARPMGGPKVELTKPGHVLGTFASTTSWGLLLFGTVLTIGGVAGAGAATYDLVAGRAGVGDVLRDIAVFVEGWIVELIAGINYDAELEKTHAYALMVLIIPGLILLWLNLIPVLNRGTAFRVEPDGSVLVRRADGWDPLLEYQYSSAVADGTTIRFDPAADGPPAVVLPQARVFCKENGARLKSEVSAQFFTELLARHGFEVATSGSGFTANRR